MDRAQTTAADSAARGADDVRALLLADTEADRRVEAWIAAGLDGRPARPGAGDWARRIELVSPARRRPDRTASEESPGAEPVWKRIRVEQRGDATVVHLLDGQLLNDGPLDELRSELRDLANAGCSRFVLSVANVERISSQFLEILASLDRQCSQRPGGRLKLCKVGPEIARILELSGLDRRFEVVPDLAAALGGPWPALPRRVPVEILGELNRRSTGALDDPPSTEPEPTDDSPASDCFAPVLSLRIVREGRQLGSPGVTPAGLRIGRETPCEIVLRNQEVSRIHAWIGERDGQCVLEDLGSTNGTTVDGRVIRSEAVPIRPGSAIAIGPYRIEVSDGAAPTVDAILSEWTADDDRVERESAFDRPLDDSRRDRVPIDPDDVCPALRSERVEGVLVLAPTEARLDDEATLDAIRHRIDELIGQSSPPIRIVVNLAPLVELSGRAIGLILAQQLRLHRIGGSMRLAQASASVATAMEIVGLASLIETYPTLDEAVLRRWPE